MRKICNRAKAAYLLLLAFVAGLIFFYVNLTINGGTWALSPYNMHIYKDGELLNSGVCVDRNGEVLAKTKDNKRVYHSDALVRKSLLHIIGDNQGNFSSIQRNYAATLSGYSALSGIYTLSKWNAVPKMKLTISAKLNKSLQSAFWGKKGAVIAYNYKTGEIVASLSAPNYDPYYEPDNLNSKTYEGIYVNRALNGMYTPGSTFKLITAISAVENISDINKRTFTCNGRQKNDDGAEIICSGHHGKISFQDGLKVSCNIVFANIATELGSSKIKATAEKFGFNKNHSMGKIPYNGGYYDAKGAKETDLGWSGIGQYTVLSSPITLAKLSGTIANGGNLIEPKLIKNISNPLGVPTNINLQMPKSVINQVTAKKLNNMMAKAAAYSFGETLAQKYSLRAKTGTAEVEDGPPHALVTGFLDDSKMPYAFAIVIENGGAASSNTAYILNVLLKGLSEIK